MRARPRRTDLPPWTTVAADDPRERDGALEPSAFVSAEWAAAVGAASNRAWSNAAKVVAAIADDQPDARYVEGWAAHGGVGACAWHAWVDVPLGRAELAWIRIDATPMWRWVMQHTHYAPVLEVRASDMLPFIEPLRRPRGRALCRLPLVPLAPRHALSSAPPTPTESIAAEFGSAVAARAAAAKASIEAHQRALTTSVHTDGRSELDRLAALGLLPSERWKGRLPPSE